MEADLIEMNRGNRMSMKNFKKALAVFAVAAMITTGIGPALTVSATSDTDPAEVAQTLAEENTEVTTEEEAAAGNTEAAAVIEEEAGETAASVVETASASSTDEEIAETEESVPVAEESAEGATEIADIGATFDTENAAVNEPLRDPVEEVEALIDAMPTLLQMQDKRLQCNTKAAYDEYLAQAWQSRAEAQAAFDALTPEEQDRVGERYVEKLNEKLDTVYNLDVSYPLEPRDDEYNYQVFLRRNNNGSFNYLAYEMAIYINKDNDFAETCVMVDVSGSDETWSPDAAYSYGTNNYEVVYCCDLRQAAKYMEHYKRLNLESSDYYSKDAASHIRAIVQNAYPYVSLEEMKADLKEAGFSYADELTRSDVIAAVQFAIWRYSNEEHPDGDIISRTTYGGTYNAHAVNFFTRLHDYRNELWDWWESSYRKTHYDEGAAEKVNALTDYLAALPGVQPEDDQIVISDVKIARTDLVPGQDNTYTLGLNIFLNHGSNSGDNVTITVTTTDADGNVTDTKTIPTGSETTYDLDITANDGDTVKVTVEGTQVLAKGVYFYEPEEGIEESQAMVGVAQGETRVKAEKSFTFDREIDAGIRIYKTEAETDLPIEDITFSIYRVADKKTADDIPTDEEIAKYAVDGNLAGTVTTDETGYANIKLDKGVYLLVEEPNDKIHAPIRPMYVVLPVKVETRDDKGEIVVTYEDVASLRLRNIPNEPGKVSVILEATKNFNDWAKAERFRFILSASADGTPMPKEDIAEATLENKTAQWGLMTFTKPGTYEYTITEIDDGVENITYDTEPHKVVITIKKDDEGNLDDEVTYDGEDFLIITNTYEERSQTGVVLGGHKTIEGTDSTDLVFHFVLEETTKGADYKDEAEVKGSGDFTFDEITYDREGTYTYKITEEKGSEKNWRYDSTEYDVTVTVSKDSEGKLTASVDGLRDGKARFTNKYNPPENPKVGDAADPALWGAIVAAAAAGITVLVNRRRRLF